MKFLFTADLHGNVIQYRKLIKYATQKECDIVIGGDIAPKYSSNYINTQKNFLKEIFPNLIRSYKGRIFIMMGNDDCKINMKELVNSNAITIHKKRMAFSSDIDIIGYSYVPITPFQNKDWEKFDLTDIPEGLEKYYEELKERWDCRGYKSTKKGWSEFFFQNNKDSIQKDLKTNMFTKNAKSTIYVFHSPPYMTNLDFLGTKKHAGSIAIRQFIKRHNPLLTLHGHIHETVDVSGKFKDEIEKSTCIAAGNHDNREELAFIEINLEKKEYKRIVI